MSRPKKKHKELVADHLEIEERQRAERLVTLVERFAIVASTTEKLSDLVGQHTDLHKKKYGRDPNDNDFDEHRVDQRLLDALVAWEISKKELAELTLTIMEP